MAQKSLKWSFSGPNGRNGMKLGVSEAQSSVLDDGIDPGIARLRVFKQNLDFREHVKKLVSMPDLDPTSTFVQNKCLVTPRCYRRLRHKEMLDF